MKKKNKYTAYVTTVDGYTPTTNKFEGEAVSAQAFHKMIFEGEGLCGQYHSSPSKKIDFIENDKGKRVFDNRKGFFGS